MPLLKPPDPKIPTRKFYVRIREPLALTLERYSEFLGTTGIDHIVNQALELIFRKDTDFKAWLAHHPEPDLRQCGPLRKRAKPATNTGKASTELRESSVAAAS